MLRRIRGEFQCCPAQRVCKSTLREDHGTKPVVCHGVLPITLPITCRGSRAGLQGNSPRTHHEEMTKHIERFSALSERSKTMKPERELHSVEGGVCTTWSLHGLFVILVAPACVLCFCPLCISAFVTSGFTRRLTNFVRRATNFAFLVRRVRYF